MLCLSVQAADFPIQRSANGQWAAPAAANAARLKGIANAQGSVRLTVVLNDTSDPGNASGNIAPQAIANLQQRFALRHANRWIGPTKLADQAPVVSLLSNAAGIDALMADAEVSWISEPIYFEEFIRETNTQLQTSLLPAPASGTLAKHYVVIIDSGAAVNHPALSGRLIAQGCSSTPGVSTTPPALWPSLCVSGASNAAPCYINSTAALQEATANCGHGTHVAGIALGNFGAADYNGMAVSSGFLAYQASSLETSFTNGEPVRRYLDVDVLNGLNFAFDNRQSGNRLLAAVNMSFGVTNAGEQACTETSKGSLFGQIRTRIDSLRNNGVSVVAAAGNEGFSSLAYPACIPGVVGVGAVNKFNRPSVFSAVVNAFGDRISLFAPGGDEYTQVANNSIPLQPMIDTDNDWSLSPSVLGSKGSGFGNNPGVNPSTLTAFNVPQPQVWANRSETNPAAFSEVGFAEFQSTNDIAVKPGASAPAPYLLLGLNTLGFSNISLSYTLVDIDNSSANAVQSFALQYRTSTTGPFTSLASAFQSDVTDGNAQGRESVVNVTLPTVLENKAFVQLRLITADANGTDEWVAIRNISVFAADTVAFQQSVPICSAADAQSLPPICSARVASNGTTGTELRAGTSMAAPHVAGLIARLRDRFPNANRQQIEDLLVQSGVATAASQTISVPRVTPFAAFRQASVPQNFALIPTSCGLTAQWAAPSLLVPTSYSVRRATTESQLGTATVTNIGSVVTHTFLESGFAQVRASDAQGDGVWSNPILLSNPACAVVNLQASTALPPGTTGCFSGVRWDAVSLASATQHQVQEICSTTSANRTESFPVSRSYKRLQRTTDTVCELNKGHEYRVRACVGSNDCGPWTSFVQQVPVALACAFSD